MKLTVVGCGDAFGSGGRLQTCYLAETGGERFLIDCGATAIIRLNGLGIDANSIGTIFISHLHGDHFAGLVWWMIHAQHVAKRTVPLTVVGPPGIEQRFVAAAEALFAGSTGVKRRYELTFREISAGTPVTEGPATVEAFEVSHPSGAPSHALRIAAGGKILSFSGDTEWVEALVPCAANADLFIAECYNFDRDSPYHMSWRTLETNLPRITARRVMLTHMNAEMLVNRHTVADPRVMLAEDNLVVTL